MSESLESRELQERQPDSVLVERAVGGDGDSFTELCRRHYGAMVAIGHSILGDRHLAEDAAQQAFAKAALNLPKLHKSEQFGSWVAAISRNAARDLLRKARRTRIADERAELAPASEPDGSGELVKSALGKLPPGDKEVIYLRFYDGLSYEQISAALGISIQAINGRLRRAKKKLAEHLRRDGFGEVQL
ncbi:MAG: sigma-70 family RNA polymerase sigma factor [Sedimentisphaerales bacterium]|nr:sigma-70 family RNA polymerase sigma factor [Sedimentisphaerales bacterium]